MDTYTAMVGQFTVAATEGMRVALTVDGKSHHLSYDQVEALILGLQQGLDRASYWGMNKQLRHPDQAFNPESVERIKERLGVQA